GWWGRLDRQSVPQLSGYVETHSKPGAEVLMEVAGSAHPVLTSWQHGLGRVTALMTEPVGEGTESWRQWRGYGQMLAGIVTRTADAGRVFHYSIERQDQQVRVTAQRLVYAPDLYPSAQLLTASGAAPQTLHFQQRAPGVFTADTLTDSRNEVQVQA